MSRTNPYLRMSPKEIKEEFFKVSHALYDAGVPFMREMDVDANYIPSRASGFRLRATAKELRELLIKYNQVSYAFYKVKHEGK